MFGLSNTSSPPINSQNQWDICRFPGLSTNTGNPKKSRAGKRARDGEIRETESERSGKRRMSPTVIRERERSSRGFLKTRARGHLSITPGPSSSSSFCPPRAKGSLFVFQEIKRPRITTVLKLSTPLSLSFSPSLFYGGTRGPARVYNALTAGVFPP